MSATVTRYAIQHETQSDLYVFALARYTMPAATENVAQAKTWASPAGARAAIERHRLTKVKVVPVERDARDFPTRSRKAHR